MLCGGWARRGGTDGNREASAVVQRLDVPTDPLRNVTVCVSLCVCTGVPHWRPLSAMSSWRCHHPAAPKPALELRR